MGRPWAFLCHFFFLFSCKNIQRIMTFHPITFIHSEYRSMRYAIFHCFSFALFLRFRIHTKIVTRLMDFDVAKFYARRRTKKASAYKNRDKNRNRMNDSFNISLLMDTNLSECGCAIIRYNNLLLWN